VTLAAVVRVGKTRREGDKWGADEGNSEGDTVTLGRVTETLDGAKGRGSILHKDSPAISNQGL
jgi:hypothetical protein